MVAKKNKYPWLSGAPIDEHTKTKHNILRQYIKDYFDIRFKNPKIRNFNFAIVDGFCGGGRYDGGESGSPLILFEEVRSAFFREKIRRAAEGMPKLQLTGTLFFNDSSQEAINFLKNEIFQKELHEGDEKLNITIQYSCKKFEDFYPEVKSYIQNNKIKNVFFNLDQFGHKHVELSTIKNIFQSFCKPEVLLTFLIEPFLTYLPNKDQERLKKQFNHLDLNPDYIKKLDWLQNGQILSYNQRIGIAENIVYNSFRECATYISPFAIYNKSGWKYWSVHFSNILRAREAYNNVLHKNAKHQAHCGPCGLNMMYSSSESENVLCLFDESAREETKRSLYNDIPRNIADNNGFSSIENFLHNAYQTTAVAHRDDILTTILQHPDITILTDKGNPRRSLNSIALDDRLILTPQRSFFFLE